MERLLENQSIIVSEKNPKFKAYFVESDNPQYTYEEVVTMLYTNALNIILSDYNNQKR